MPQERIGEVVGGRIRWTAADSVRQYRTFDVQAAMGEKPTSLGSTLAAGSAGSVVLASAKPTISPRMAEFHLLRSSQRTAGLLIGLAAAWPDLTPRLTGR